MPAARAARKPADKGARTGTKRLVLKRVRVRVLPDSDKDTKAIEAWVECGEFTGSKVGAIEAFAGKPGAADAKVGIFKAPSVTSMKGGAEYVQPQLPKVERTVLK